VEILMYDPYLADYDAGVLGVEKTSLEDLFSRADIISVHAPSLPETNRMVNEKHFNLMRDGAVLVNTSRGSVIDHSAMLKACQSGKITIGLDVSTPEPLPADSPFRELPNVIVTPHMAGAGHYGYFRIGDMTIQALIDFFTGSRPVGSIDPSEFSRLA
jgi:phosphoglycerate dehydrogenase-like enzyme